MLCQIDETEMRNILFYILTAFVAWLPVSADAQQQTSQPAAAGRAATVVPTPRSEWLGSFKGISISGRMHVRVIKNLVEEGPRITYDTKGELSAKFKAAVDRSGILKVEEPTDPKRTTVTEVTIWCNDISSLSVSGADLTVENTIICDMFDLEVSGGANVTAAFEVTDLSITATGRSSLVIDGSAKYMALDISTAKFDGLSLSTVASIVEASHMAEVRLSVSERLQGTTSTSAKIYYSGQPRILRSRTTMFGGEIAPLAN